MSIHKAMARNLKPVAQKQYLVTMGGQQAYFQKCTAPKIKRDTVDYNDGQTGQTLEHVTFAKTEHVTLSKVFDPEKDKGLIEFYNKTLTEGQQQDWNISIQPVTTDLQGKPVQGAGTIILNSCQFVAITYPEADRMGSGMSMLEFEVLYDNITYQ